MKKGLLVVFLLAAVLFPVFAADEGLKIGDTTWKFNGEIRFMYTDQTDPDYYSMMAIKKALDPTIADQFNRMYQRYRFGVTGELNERLSAHFTLQVGDEQWGNKNYNEREVNIRTLFAYLQFRPEILGDNTTFKVGLQGYDDIFQYSIFSDEAVGILISQNMDKFNATVGYLTLRDDDVDQETDPEDGIVATANTLFIADMNFKATDALTIKGAFYYDYIKNLDIDYFDPYTDYLRYTMAFYGIGVDYVMNDSLNFGGHFVMRSGNTLIRDDVTDHEEYNVDQKGFFAYAYAGYTMDKFSAKVNFGYTPFNVDGDGSTVTYTSWGGAFALIDNHYEPLLSNGAGDQWQTAYGLEYFGRGDVCDRQAVQGGYGGLTGLMVISANLSYDFMYANFGIMRSTISEDIAGDDFERSYGTELDLGVKTEIMKGLEFKAVYAMFFTGNFYTFYDDEKLDNGHEMSMLLRYTF